MTPAGWYLDPNDPRFLRWWDGYQWTVATHPAPASAVPVDAVATWKAEGDGAGLVFPAASGGVEARRMDLERWRRSLARAGVRQVPLHGARGTAASVLLELGVPDRWIADILGHSNPTVTQAHYLHSDQEQRLKSLEELTDALDLRPVGPA